MTAVFRFPPTLLLFVFFEGIVCQSQWIQDTTTGAMPSPENGRMAGAILPMYSGNNVSVLLFGGSSTINNLWKFDIYPIRGWSLYGSSTAVPTARMNFVMEYDTKNQVAFLYGGIVPGMVAQSDGWVLNCASGTWTLATSSGVTLPATYRQAMIYNPAFSNFIMHGGIDGGNTLLSSSYAISLNNSGSSWSYSAALISHTSSAPAIRSHSMTLFGLNSAIVFGGSGINFPPIFNNFYVIQITSPTTISWSSPYTYPYNSPKMAHRTEFDDVTSELYILGGYDGSNAVSSVAVLNCSNGDPALWTSRQGPSLVAITDYPMTRILKTYRTVSIFMYGGAGILGPFPAAGSEYNYIQELPLHNVTIISTANTSPRKLTSMTLQNSTSFFVSSSTVMILRVTASSNAIPIATGAADNDLFGIGFENDIIVLTAGVIILIVAIAAFVSCFWKRRRNRLRKKESIAESNLQLTGPTAYSMDNLSNMVLPVSNFRTSARSIFNPDQIIVMDANTVVKPYVTNRFIQGQEFGSTIYDSAIEGYSPPTRTGGNEKTCTLTDYFDAKPKVSENTLMDTRKTFSLPGFLQLQSLDDVMLTEELSHGSTGVIWKAMVLNETIAQKNGGSRNVAVKIISCYSDDSTESEFQDMLYACLQEVTILHSLAPHANICGLLAYTEIPTGDFILVQPLYQTDLNTVIHKRQSGATSSPAASTKSKHSKHVYSLNIEDIVIILYGLAEALVWLHQHGVIHFDVKPANVLINLHNSMDIIDSPAVVYDFKSAHAALPKAMYVPVLADFGLASLEAASSITKVEGATLSELFENVAPVCGRKQTSIGGLSTRYASPERMQWFMTKMGMLPNDLQPVRVSFVKRSSTDVWAFGILAWEMNSRRVPFEKLLDLQVQNIILKGSIDFAFKDCPDAASMMLHKTIKKCWITDLDSRPASYTVVQELGKIAELLSSQKSCNQ